MRTTYLLSTAAAALLLTAGAAPAETLQNVKPERAPAAQQNAPAEKIAPPMHAGERKTPETTGQASQEKANKPDKAELKGHGKSETTGQAPKASDSGKAEMKDQGDSSHGAAKSSSDTKSSSETKSGVGVKDNAAGKSGASQKSSESSSTKSSTSGQGAAGAAKLSSEQRTKITTIFKKQKVAPAHVNISVHVGARVPASVHFYPVPVEVIEVYPEWRGYLFILVGDEILIVEPRTHEIVAILEA